MSGYLISMFFRPIRRKPVSLDGYLYTFQVKTEEKISTRPSHKVKKESLVHIFALQQRHFYHVFIKRSHLKTTILYKKISFFDQELKHLNLYQLAPIIVCCRMQMVRCDCRIKKLCTLGAFELIDSFYLFLLVYFLIKCICSDGITLKYIIIKILLFI